MEQRKSIVWIGGSKGGVGKSMVTMAMVDYLQDKGEDVLLVDCDTSNPDASKAYRAHTDTALLNLDEVDGWIARTLDDDIDRAWGVIEEARESADSLRRLPRHAAWLTRSGLPGSLQRSRIALFASHGWTCFGDPAPRSCTPTLGKSKRHGPSSARWPIGWP